MFVHFYETCITIYYLLLYFCNPITLVSLFLSLSLSLCLDFGFTFLHIHQKKKICVLNLSLRIIAPEIIKIQEREKKTLINLFLSFCGPSSVSLTHSLSVLSSSFLVSLSFSYSFGVFLLLRSDVKESKSERALVWSGF